MHFACHFSRPESIEQLESDRATGLNPKLIHQTGIRGTANAVSFILR